jgi:hypothetical protein
MWWITPEPVIGPRLARTRWANPPYELSWWKTNGMTGNRQAGRYFFGLRSWKDAAVVGRVSESVTRHHEYDSFG